MASSASSEASEIRRRGRQRLIGAVVLVALLVVFVPMLLDSQPRTPARDTPALQIPPKDNPTPLAPPKAAATAPEAPKAATPAPAPAKDAPAPPEPAKTAPAPAASVAVTPPKSASAADPTPAQLKAGFAVQVGAFRDEAKLKQAREKLAGAGVVHYTERLDSKSGQLTRLRAGPFASREAAEAALVKVRRVALDGKVVPLP